MTRTVVFRPEADEEAAEVHRWYEAKRLGLGDEFGAEVDAAIARIIEHPFAYPVVRGETRRVVLDRFPYALYFRVMPETIVVLAVHGRQDPARWQRRT